MALRYWISAILVTCGLSLAATAAVGRARPQTEAASNTRFNVNLKFPTLKERAPVRFELVNGVLVFRATVDGKEVWAILDNRLESSLIDSGFARTAGISLGPTIGPMRTPTGSLPRQLTSYVQINVPGQISINARLSAIDLSFLAKATGRPISLALGKEYFGNLLFLIKPSNNTFQLGPSGANLNTPANVTPIALLSDRPKLAVVVNGVALQVTLDLGYNGTIALSSEAWIKTGLDKQPSIQRKSARLEGMIFTVPHATASTVQLGAARFTNMDASRQPVLPDDGDGMIGLGLLSLFDFALDIKAGKLWLISKAR
jgi:hypothetical protein